MLKNKILKHSIAKIFVFAIALMALTSCESEVIDLLPINKFSDLTAYETPERCELSVIGAYDAAQCGLYTNGSYVRGYPFGAASILQGEMRGEDMINLQAFYDYTYSATYNTTTANNVAYWEASFEAINRYNTVIRGIETAVKNEIITEEKGKDYKGELLYLRALTYHGLLIHYALPYNVTGNNNYGLPLYLTANNTPSEIEEALKIGRSTVEQTYDQVLADLNEAETLFTSNAKNSANGITRASKGAVIALKTRVYLHKRDWAGVKTEAAKLVTGTAAPFTSPIGAYSLTASPATPFTSYAANSESIFSIENGSDDNGSVNGSMAQMMTGRSGGRSLVSSSPILYNSSYWLGDDKRRDLVIYNAGTDVYHVDKYQEVTSQADYAPIIRYAEVLLNYAEAALRANPQNKTLALELLNAVRNRSLANPVTQAYTLADFADDKAFLDAILWERRIEFHGEGRRWEDIHRLATDDISPSGGIPAKIEYGNIDKASFVVGGAVDASFYSPSKRFIPYTDKRFIWPIPQNDIVRNPMLKTQQNVGW
jgi:hypothetical protein